MRDLGALEGSYLSWAYAVNPAGTVVGESLLGDGEHAWMWKNGVTTDLGSLGGTTTRAYAINPSGDVVGIATTAGGDFHAFLWRDGTMIDLNQAPAGNSIATAINPAGQVAGLSGSHAAIWTIR